jgi:hypothetical protein
MYLFINGMRSREADKRKLNSVSMLSSYYEDAHAWHWCGDMT